MKNLTKSQIIIACITLIALYSCQEHHQQSEINPSLNDKNNHQMNNVKITSERISKTAIIVLNGSIENVFPLFEPYEEKKWAEGWNPIPIYSLENKIEEGTTFKTIRHKQNETDILETEFLWIISKFQPENYLIQYLVSTPNRYWTVTIQCQSIANNKTKASITYTYTGLNNIGNEANKVALEKMYKNDLKDWEEAINYYLDNGTMLIH
ncbi:MAG: hypothetical protein GW809_03450 [Bacteroidetes bacterium]|nr:hypothetical protein [Bacteroidota bacterium]